MLKHFSVVSYSHLLKSLDQIQIIFSNLLGSQSSSTVNLIKRFTNLKRSKSPTNQPSYSMDNPVFEDNTVGNNENAVSTTSANKRNTIHLSHPVHVRSGSLPVEISLGAVPSASGIVTKAEIFGSHRIKAHKERPTLQGYSITHIFIILLVVHSFKCIFHYLSD